ncbi:MAG: S24/S26 family peptidase, partial [Candidatus Omnitrophota bacterium]
MYVNCSNEEWLALVNDILIRNKSLYVRLGGESMYPTIKNGEIVKIEPLQDKVNNNEVILYRDDRGKPIVHRVIKMDTQGDRPNYLVRSDNNWLGGDIVEESQVLGKVTFVRRANSDMPV